MIYPVILAGGSGSRLWPVSDQQTPKQFLKLFNDRTLFQNTLERLKGFAEPGHFKTSCNINHKGRIEGELLELDLPIESHVIAEPVARNTAPAIYMASRVVQQLDKDAVLVVLPADHYVTDVPGFQATLRRAVESAKTGKIVTLGIRPTAPETGYGYIEAANFDGEEARDVVRFVEKPNAEKAAEYLASGRFVWNSGIFVFRADTMVQEFQNYQKEVVGAVEAFLDGDEEGYGRSPKISVDYAIMEHTRVATVVPASFGWSDVGNWTAVSDLAEKDDDGNAIDGDVISIDCKNTYVKATSRRVATVGVENVAVLETPDGVLVVDKDQVQKVSKVSSAPPNDEAWGYTEHRPWGSYTILGSSDSFKTKRLDVLPGKRLSLQSHKKRTEYWIVVAGKARVTRDDELLDLGPTETVIIPVGAKHRIENPGNELLTIIEVQLGDYFGEDDIVRYQDDFGRQ